MLKHVKKVLTWVFVWALSVYNTGNSTTPNLALHLFPFHFILFLCPHHPPVLANLPLKQFLRSVPSFLHCTLQMLLLCVCGSWNGSTLFYSCCFSYGMALLNVLCCLLALNSLIPGPWLSLSFFCSPPILMLSYCLIPQRILIFIFSLSFCLFTCLLPLIISYPPSTWNPTWFLQLHFVSPP